MCVVIGELVQAFSHPPLVGEDVVGFRLVATIDKASADSSPAPVPALLILTQSHDDEENGEDIHKHLKVVTFITLICTISLFLNVY